MTDITQQARAAAEEVANWMNWKKDVHPYAHEQNIETLTRMLTPYVHPPSLTEAIEEVRDYRKWYDETMFTPVTIEETQAVHQQFNGMVDRIAAESARHTIDQLVEKLSTLQGKAGVNEPSLQQIKGAVDNVLEFFQEVYRKQIPDDSIENYSVVRELRAALAATTPASVEAKLCSICIAAGRVYCPPEHRQAYDITGEELTTTAPPEQQSPRVCVRCNHAEHWSSNHHRRCAYLYTSMDGGSTCGCKCVFPD